MRQRLAMSPGEVRKELGVSRSLVYKLLADGSLPSVRLGSRRIVIPTAGLERFLSSEIGRRKEA